LNPVGILVCWLNGIGRGTNHVIFSGQNFYEAQSRNCASEKTYACPARKTGGDNATG
jgi:hypothetical protein